MGICISQASAAGRQVSALARIFCEGSESYFFGLIRHTRSPTPDVRRLKPDAWFARRIIEPFRRSRFLMADG
ncbi:MAG: hypothetical protein DMG94_04430 [Acidobacteria bacterium]|nr:MAG: hypothetical protein DMG94_04430 [Acidobacteriota bacterium]